MNHFEKNKSLLEGYVGVKFHAVQVSTELMSEAADLYGAFEATCNRLSRHDMTPANAGNLSVRHGDGFFISSSGCNLGCMEMEELIFVERCDAGAEEVRYRGPSKPSSESIMHCLIYEHRPEAGAIIHAHDEFATRPELLVGEVAESEREEPYGSIALARMAIETFKTNERIIVLKNHGYVAIGPDLESACDLVIKTHLRLLGKVKGSATPDSPLLLGTCRSD